MTFMQGLYVPIYMVIWILYHAMVPYFIKQHFLIYIFLIAQDLNIAKDFSMILFWNMYFVHHQKCRYTKIYIYNLSLIKESQNYIQYKKEDERGKLIQLKLTYYNKSRWGFH